MSPFCHNHRFVVEAQFWRFEEGVYSSHRWAVILLSCIMELFLRSPLWSDLFSPLIHLELCILRICLLFSRGGELSCTDVVDAVCRPTQLADTFLLRSNYLDRLPQSPPAITSLTSTPHSTGHLLVSLPFDPSSTSEHLATLLSSYSSLFFRFSTSLSLQQLHCSIRPLFSLFWLVDVQQDTVLQQRSPFAKLLSRRDCINSISSPLLSSPHFLAAFTIRVSTFSRWRSVLSRTCWRLFPSWHLLQSPPTHHCDIIYSSSEQSFRPCSNRNFVVWLGVWEGGTTWRRSLLKLAGGEWINSTESREGYQGQPILPSSVLDFPSILHLRVIF